MVTEWLSPADLEKLATGAARSGDADLMRTIARAMDSKGKVIPRRTATKRLRQLLAVASACKPAPMCRGASDE